MSLNILIQIFESLSFGICMRITLHDSEIQNKSIVRGKWRIFTNSLLQRLNGQLRMCWERDPCINVNMDWSQ